MLAGKPGVPWAGDSCRAVPSARRSALGRPPLSSSSCPGARPPSKQAPFQSVAAPGWDGQGLLCARLDQELGGICPRGRAGGGEESGCGGVGEGAARASLAVFTPRCALVFPTQQSQRSNSGSQAQSGSRSWRAALRDSRPPALAWLSRPPRAA